MNKATTNAVKNAKAQAKIEAAKAKAIAPKVVVQEQPAKKREPKANNQPRKGPRRERIPKEDNDGFVAATNDSAAPAQRDNNRRQNRRPKNADKKSGDPKTGRKAYEKRGGAGAGNWGKADENLDEAIKELD